MELVTSTAAKRRPLDEVEAENGDPRIRYFIGSNKKRIRVDQFINIFERQFPIDRVSSVRPIYDYRLPLVIKALLRVLTTLIDLAVLATVYMVIGALIIFFASLQGFLLEIIVTWIPIKQWFPKTQDWSISNTAALILALVSAVIWLASIILYAARNLLKYLFTKNWIEVMLIDGHIERFRLDVEESKYYRLFTWAENYLSGKIFSSDSVPIIQPSLFSLNNEDLSKKLWPEFNPAQLLQLNFKSTVLKFHLISLKPISFGKWYWIEAVVMGHSGVEVRKGRRGPLSEVQKAGLGLFQVISGPDALTYIGGYGEAELGTSYKSEIISLRGKHPSW